MLSNVEDTDTTRRRADPEGVRSMWGTLYLITMLALFLLALSEAAGGPGRDGLAARLAHGGRELDRLAALRSALDRRVA